jgi:hypothetical protein
MDMIVAGDWMELKVLINEKGHFRDSKAFGSAVTSGWWNCIATGDIDNDGDIDFVAGNHGLNSRFKASPGKPVTMYVNDFDMNGVIEQIICTYDGDISYPFALKHDLVNQIPELQRRYPKYDMYKDQKIEDIFSPSQLQNAIKLQVEMLETSVFLNDGKGNFKQLALPEEVQFSPVYAAKISDFDSDGNPDILMAGNLFNVKPEAGRYDAGYGFYLSGVGKGGFRYVAPQSSGYSLNGETRDFLQIKTSMGNLLFVAQNNSSLKVFRLLKK